MVVSIICGLILAAGYCHKSHKGTAHQEFIGCVVFCVIMVFSLVWLQRTTERRTVEKVASGEIVYEIKTDTIINYGFINKINHE